MAISTISRWKSLIFAVLLLGFPLGLTSCGSGPAGGGTGPFAAGGGIGGTGLYAGQVTGFGSLFVNGSEINTDAAQFIVNGNPNATQGDIAIGMKVVIETAGGAAKTVVYEPEVAGTVELVNVGDKLLEVMGQTVYVDRFAGPTTFKGVVDISGLRAGDDVMVSGLFDADGDLHASFVELAAPPLQTNKVKGVVRSLDPIVKTFKLSQLVVDYPSLPDPGIRGGSFVKVEGSYQGNLNLIAAKIEVDTPAPAASPGWYVELEGIVTKVPPGTPPGEFELNGQSVRTDAGTRFTSGAAADIALNRRVTVRGAADNGGTIIADQVEFH